MNLTLKKSAMIALVLFSCWVAQANEQCLDTKALEERIKKANKECGDEMEKVKKKYRDQLSNDLKNQKSGLWPVRGKKN